MASARHMAWTSGCLHAGTISAHHTRFMSGSVFTCGDQLLHLPTCRFRRHAKNRHMQNHGRTMPLLPKRGTVITGRQQESRHEQPGRHHLSGCSGRSRAKSPAVLAIEDGVCMMELISQLRRELRSMQLPPVRLSMRIAVWLAMASSLSCAIGITSLRPMRIISVILSARVTG